MRKIITVLFAVLAMSSMFAYIPNKKNVEIKDIDKYAKKYNNYMLVNYEQTYLIVGQNLDNKRMMCVEFLLEKQTK